MSADQPYVPTTQQLQSKLDSALDTVQQHSDRLKRDLVEPSLARGKDLGGRFPVGTTFIVVFTVLSIVPILSFLSVAAFVSFVAVTTVVGCAVFISSVLFGAVCLALCLLIPTLCITLSLATFAVVTLVSGFLALRLYTHLRSAPTLPSALHQTQTDLSTLLSPELTLVQSLLPFPSSSSSANGPSKSGVLSLDSAHEQKMDGLLDDAQRALDRANGQAREALCDIKQEEQDGAEVDGKAKGE